MQDSDAQKSEVHESTDDASSAPSSNARQHTDSPPQGQGATPGTGATRTHVPGVGTPASNFERGAAERTRTNVAGVSPAEADDLSNAPPGHVDLEADLDGDRPLYPTTRTTGGVGAADGNSGGTDMRIGDKIRDGDKEEDREK